MNPFFKDYSAYLAEFFPGTKVQKISVNTGSGCPNRDGTVGTGGCIYCDNASFTPGYCLEGGSVAAQLEAGKRFFRRKYPKMKYLAYFQSYTSTHRNSLQRLAAQYREALEVEDVLGIIVATRPDCLPDDVLCLLEEINQGRPVFVELGVETLCDHTLRLINRGHTARQACDAICRAAGRRLHVGVHLIAGLPGENDERVLETLRGICSLPVESVKMHHLQVLRQTPLAAMLERGEVGVESYTLERYLDLCVRMVEAVPHHIAIERFLASSPPEKVISPKWGLKNYEFMNLLLRKLSQNPK